VNRLVRNKGKTPLYRAGNWRIDALMMRRFWKVAGKLRRIDEFSDEMKQGCTLGRAITWP